MFMGVLRFVCMGIDAAIHLGLASPPMTTRSGRET